MSQKAIEGILTEAIIVLMNLSIGKQCENIVQNPIAEISECNGVDWFPDRKQY